MKLSEQDKTAINQLCEKAFRFAVQTHSVLKPQEDEIDLHAPLKTYFPIAEGELVEPGHEQLGRIMYTTGQYIEWASANFSEYLGGKEIRYETYFPNTFEAFPTLQELFNEIHNEMCLIFEENGY